MDSRQDYIVGLLRRRPFLILSIVTTFLVFGIYFSVFIKKTKRLSIPTQNQMTVALQSRPGNQRTFVKGGGGPSGQTRKYSITVKLMGRLGNQMSQYAALLGIADKLNMTPIVNQSATLERFFDIPHVSNTTLNLKEATDFDSDCCTYKPVPVTEHPCNMHLYGYFRSWKYFVNSSQLVRKSLRFKENVLASAKQFLQEIKRPNSTLVGIHVRRGDFLGNASVKLGRRVPGPEYLERAQKYFLSKFKNVQFLVLTNAKKWCQKNIKGTNIIQSPYTKPGIDMALMSMCDHVIMTVGTFGWWGAWLAGGITVYYKDHLRPGSSLYNRTRDADVFPLDWKGLS